MINTSADIIPIGDGANPRPEVAYCSESQGRKIQHRVFASNPAGACNLCRQCVVHEEADGRFYCDRDAESDGTPLPLRLTSA